MIEIDTIWSMVVLISGVLLYIGFKIPSTRKQMKIGLLMFAYVRDIGAILISKLTNEWNEYSIPRKLEILKAIYDLIDEFENTTVEKKKDVTNFKFGDEKFEF